MAILDKKKLSNIIFLVVFGILFFTPLGQPVKVFIHRLVAFSPSVESVEEKEVLNDYEWILEDLNGQRTYLGDLQGEVVVVNFWATWCPPCIAEMPSLQELYSEYGDRVTFLFVSQEEKPTLVKFLNKKGYDLPVYNPLSKIPEQLYSRSIPATFILDREGGIRVSKIGVADWNSDKVKTLLDELLGS